MDKKNNVAQTMDLMSQEKDVTKKLKTLELKKARGGGFCMGCWTMPSAIGLIHGDGPINDDPDGDSEGP